MWRLLGFDIHYHWPPLERLHVHLPFMNIVTLQKNAKLKSIISDPNKQKIMLTEWFEANKKHEEARDLTYCDFPLKWTWDSKNRKWVKRKQGFKIGRLYYVNLVEGERFYLRMLLMIVKGATSYEDIKTYNSILYQTFKEACAARGLLSDDNEWYKAFDEVVNWATSSQLRYLFVTMLIFCNLQGEKNFYNKNWRKMVDDIELQLIIKHHPIKYYPTVIELQDLLFVDLEEILIKNGKSIKKL
jgi:hypothetical protein